MSSISPSNVHEIAVRVMNSEDIDHHRSDLYLKKNKASEQIVKAYEYGQSVSTFKSAIDGSLWYDIPFAYSPFFVRGE